MINSNHILIFSISYLLFFVLLCLSKEKKGNRLFDKNGMVANRGMLIKLHAGGILLLGVTPLLIPGHHLQGILVGKTSPNDLQITVTVFFTILAIVIAPSLAEKEHRLMKCNSTINSSFGRKFITNYFFVRILFLCSYEIWFRGYLLTDCINSIGIPAAIVLNIILYAFLHYVNGKNEMLGCIPFGLLLCGLCIWIGAVWPAIIIHLALAISYEYHLLKKNNKSSISFV